jgi:hypothetical protein
MKLLLPNLLSSEEATELSGMGQGKIPLSSESLVIKKIQDAIVEVVGSVSWVLPAYMRIESRPGGCDWHIDTGTKNHMAWCRYGCSIALSDGTDEEVGYIEYGDGEIVRNYLSLAIHSSDERHRVPASSRRLTFLCFLGS